jgi:hypothetical protein
LSFENPLISTIFACIFFMLVSICFNLVFSFYCLLLESKRKSRMTLPGLQTGGDLGSGWSARPVWLFRTGCPLSKKCVMKFQKVFSSFNVMGIGEGHKIWLPLFFHLCMIKLKVLLFSTIISCYCLSRWKKSAFVLYDYQLLLSIYMNVF